MKVVYGNSYIVAIILSTTRVGVERDIPRERSSAECECSTDCGGDTHFQVILNKKELCGGEYRGNRTAVVWVWLLVWDIGNWNGCTNFNF